MNAQQSALWFCITILISACGPTPAASQPPLTADTLPLPPATIATPEFPQYFTEEFDQDLENWPAYIVDGRQSVIARDGLPEAVLTANGSSFEFDLKRTYLWAYAMYDPFDYEDVRVDARVVNQGVNNNNVSLICRYSPDNGWYEFNIANNGLFWIFHAKPREDGFVAYKILDEGGSNQIKTGLDANEYAIVCKGNTLTLFVNDTLTREINDTGLSTGKVGVSVSSFINLPVKVSFDWVKISAP